MFSNHFSFSRIIVYKKKLNLEDFQHHWRLEGSLRRLIYCLDLILTCLELWQRDMAMAVCDALISSIGGKVVDLLVVPVGRQFDYVLNRVKHIKDLQAQVQNLEAQREDVLDSINAAERNREEILESVKNWIDKVSRFIREAKEFLEGGANVNQKCFYGWFPDLVTRRRLGKAAKNKAEEAKELGKEGTFNNKISKPAPPLGIESLPSEQPVPYASRNLAMTNVMEALSDDNINFIGIHGIGGVGKTTLVKEIAKKAKSNKLFDDAVMAIVSQNPDIKKIQGQIASWLGFTELNNKENEIERATMLCAKLKDVKKILVILDDVWAKLNWEDVGIPFGNDHPGCKIIITTRREQVCRTMGNEWEKTKIVWLDVLPEQDSWDLFRKNVGDVVASSALNDVAREVCKECGGLPIAVVTVAKAMKGKSNLEEWKNAAQELKKSVPTNIEGVHQQVYKSLRLSYDYLLDEEAKDCFLLCSLFPEDHDILVEDLVRYGMGLRLFKNVDTVQEVRGRAKSVINNLRDSCLLLASDEKDKIKMHDVVRDVAIFIGSKKHFVRAGCNLKDWPNMDSLDQYTGMSLMGNQISNLPEVLECPNLQILLLQYNREAWSCSHEFFSRMNALSVLDLSQPLYHDFDNPIRSPDAFNNQTCLRTLVLDRIEFEDTKFLGQLKTLEVLSLRNAFFFEAPNAIRELTNLRLLDMTESRHEFLIPAAMVSPLSHLEELYLFGITSSSIEYPAVEVVAALRSLHRLKMLTISIPDIAYIPKDFVFPELESFIIFIGKSIFDLKYEYYSSNYLVLGNLVGTMVNWSKWLKMVLKRATRLRIESCSELEYLINTEEWGISSQAQPRDLQLLFNLEELELYWLDSFKGICAASALTTSSWVCFPKLRTLRVWICPSLSTVLLPFNLLQRLQHLENLSVEDCEKLEQVFDFGSEGEGMKHILNCSSRQHVQLCNLRSMKVFSCGKLKYVFQPSIAQALHQLEQLWVVDCEEMEEIVAAKQNEGQQEEEERVDYKMVFKSLRTLYLERLPNLSGFCTGGDDFPFEWPSLERLVLIRCPKMKTFAATTSGGTPKLKEVVVDNYEKIPLQGMDLNQQDILMLLKMKSNCEPNYEFMTNNSHE
ncbi:Disease resistance protein [Camellia lanceoleosa]|uniref:Disease resistance protein n=1 Tax=Camellia lanceoleosa TaxID=1840588 RepID=A0ACC0GF02_9ERIC|nr:Disease resistance protein [Camellia lanceoleosa]